MLKYSSCFITAICAHCFLFTQVWVAQDLDFGENIFGLRDLSIVDENTVWVTAYDGINPFVVNRLEFSRTIDGGANWMSGTVGTDLDLVTSSLSAVSATEAWVSMYNGVVGLGGGLFHTTNAGVDWSLSGDGLIFDANSFVDFVTFKDDEHGVAVGDPNGGYYEIYTTNNSGVDWQRIESAAIPEPLSGEYGTLSFATHGNSIWFGTTKGRIIYSHDYGETWNVSTVFTESNYFNRIAFRNETNGLTIVIDGSATPLLYATTDGGVTWSSVEDTPFLKSGSLCAIPGTSTYLSCSQNTNPLWGTSISVDDGATWIELETDDNRGTVAFYNAATGWCGGFSGPGQLGGIFKYNGNLLAHQAQKNNSNPITIYPNPTESEIYFKSNIQPTNEISITMNNVFGEIVYQQVVQENISLQQIAINLTPLTAGFYTITFTDGNFSVTQIVCKQ